MERLKCTREDGDDHNNGETKSCCPSTQSSGSCQAQRQNMECLKCGREDGDDHDNGKPKSCCPSARSSGSSQDRWNKCYEYEDIPWDLGQATPLVAHLVQSGSLPKGRGLVPGCGTGYDVVEMASPERYVVGLDISEKAMERSRKLFSSVPNVDNFTFVAADFFSWKTTESFFCAIDPSMRSAWAKRMHELLTVDGELIILMFPVDDHSGGPPFKVSFEAYDEVLRALGFEVIKVEDNGYAVESRKGNTGKVEKDLKPFFNGWDKCWEEDFAPWDLGKPTPVVLHLVQNGSLPKGRGLVPGCGSGYDVVALASADRFVVGLDISEKAITRAKGLFSSATNFDNFAFIAADFFTWRPTELFDFIFDYTFFCGLEPSMRLAWAKRMHELLRIDGELITLMFPVNYEEVLHPFGFKAITIEDNQLAIKPRKCSET
ncbi:putative thiol methyltransferase 2 [Nymphaea thermarum]|nr:putative thiol methyltransferase 2 [Nymphaea thermarum]